MRLICLSLILVLSADTAVSADYLSAELRSAVEQLKQDVADQPSNRENGVARSQVLWKWANAHALNGGTLPVELPALIARVMGRNATEPGNMLLMDQSIRELKIRDERPNAIGKLTTDSTGPFAPGSFVTIRQTYHFGDMPMVEGGGFLVAKHFMSNQGLYQTSNPEQDNYITIRSSNHAAKFEPNTRALQGMHGGFRRGAPGLFFVLREGRLRKGDTVTITYGDRSGGSKGFRVQTYSNDAFPLPIYVNLRGNRDLYTLPLQTYRIGGGSTVSVRGFVPSMVAPGEKFDISVRSEDFYYNRASGITPAYQVSVNGRPFASIPAGKGSVTLLKNRSFDEPGIYRFKIRSPDGQIKGESNPVWVRADAGPRVYWGETHGHCGFAEGQGTPDAYFKFGRDDARLDFLTLSEHDLWMDDFEWKTLLQKTEQYNEDGKFVAIAGYEWTVKTRFGGHHNVFFRDTTDRKRVPNQTAPVLSQLYRRLANENDMKDVLIIPHAHQPGEYRMNEAHMETLVEIMSMHGYFEWFGRMYLKHGHEVGFIAASDDHLSHPGYSTPLPGGLAARGGLAAVWAEEKTRDSIFSAMKNLSAYATTGDRIILDLKLNGSPMGRRLPQKVKRRIVGKIVGTAPIDQITVIKNGSPIWTKDLLTEVSGDADVQRYEISFHSSTEPGVRDSPRGWRPWRGNVLVSGAKLKTVESPSLENRLSESVGPPGDNPNEVPLRLMTRGAHKNLVLELAEIRPDAKIQLQLNGATERPSTPAMYRTPARLERRLVEFSLAKLADGRQRDVRRVEQFTDTVQLRRIRYDGELVYDLEFTDTKLPRQGDYYYVRVRQLNGEIAWSSPWWVGGFSKRTEK